jgi:IS30 family transposase
MTYRIPTVPLRGRPPSLSLEQQERLDEWARNRRTMRDWAAEFGVSKNTISRYVKGALKFPVRA